MRVLMVGWEFPPHNSGGLGVACQGLAEALGKTDLELVFVLPFECTSPLPGVRFVSPQIDISLKRGSISGYARPSTHLDTFGTKTKVPAGSLLSQVYAYAESLKATNIQEQFDLIHVHDWLTYPAGWMLKEKLDVPLIIHVHATEYDRTGGRGANMFVREIEGEAMRRADHIITVSNYTRQVIEREYQADAEKVSVVHNGVERYSIRELDESEKVKIAGKKLVLFLGRITIQKGPDYFLQAARRVLDHYPQAHFVMAGSGDMEAQVIEEALALGIADNITFTGFLSREKVNQIYQSADVYVMPSVSEPFGIAPLEAMANGTPTIISKQSGVSEVLAHSLKVDFWDVEELTNKIVAVLQHSPLQTELTENGRSEVDTITWHEAARKCLSVYQQLASSAL